MRGRDARAKQRLQLTSVVMMDKELYLVIVGLSFKKYL